jgi:hypothetical protein
MDEVQKRQLILYGRTNRMEEARWRREYWNGYHRTGVHEAGRDGTGKTGRKVTETGDWAEEVCYRKEVWRLGAGKRRQLSNNPRAHTHTHTHIHTHTHTHTNTHTHTHTHTHIYIYIYIYIYLFSSSRINTYQWEVKRFSISAVLTQTLRILTCCISFPLPFSQSWQHRWPLCSLLE